MLTGIDIPEILRAALRRGGDLSELFWEESAATAIIREGGRMETAIAGMDAGAGIRVLRGASAGYSYTNDVTRTGLLEAARAASEAVGTARPGTPASLTRMKPSGTRRITRPPGKALLEEKIAIVQRADRAAWGAGPRIRQVQAAYRDHERKILIANSRGVLTSDTQTRVVLAVTAVARGGRVIQRGYETAGGLAGLELFDAVPPETVGRTAADRAIRMIAARPAPGGTMPVILSKEAGGTMIHEAVGHGLEADHVQEGTSVYEGKVGTRVASDLITVVDDATIPGKRGSFGVDDEGTPARRTTLVDRGILVGFLHSLSTAGKDHVEPTGNGRRESYRHRPLPRMTNILILPGPHDPRSIIASVHKGIFVKKMGGGQVNTVTGDFVFEVAEGYLIERGKPGDPIRGAILTGNGPRVLETIDMVGTDLGYGIGTCGKDGQGVPVADAQPTLRIPELVVGGEVR